MYILNTTYNVDITIQTNWFKFIEQYAVPVVKQGGYLQKIKLLQLNNLPNNEGITYALQSEVINKTQFVDLQQEWDNIHLEMRKIFGEKVLFFSTELEIVTEF